MKFQVVLVLFIVFQFAANAQKVDYSLPKTHQKFLKKKEYRQLLEYTFRQLEGYDIHEVRSGEVSIKLGDYPHTFSMLPLIQQCATLTNEERQYLIQDYISSLISAYYDQRLLAEADFSTVRKYLTLRLYPEDAIDETDRERWVVRSEIEGTVSCVALNLPTAFATVERSQLHQWNVSEAELYEIATENSQNRTYEIHQRMLDETTEIIALADADYAASAAYALDKIVPEHIGEHGAIVAIPHRDMLLIHNLGDDEIADYQKFVRYLHSFVLEQYDQHTAPVSPHFYWYYQGEYTRIRLGKDQKGNLHIFPPSALSWSTEE